MESPYGCEPCCCITAPCCVADACGGVFRTNKPRWWSAKGAVVKMPAGALVTVHARHDGQRSGMGDVLVIKDVMPPYIFLVNARTYGGIGPISYQDDLREIQLLPITNRFARAVLGKTWKALVAQARAVE